MASSLIIQAIFLVLLYNSVDTSTSYLLRGSVTCLDCSTQHNFSGIVVGTRCNDDNLLSVLTNYKGYFEVGIPAKFSDVCVAKLLGGPKQLCAYEKSISTKIIKPQGQDDYALATPLAFLTSCPNNAGQQRPQEMINVEGTPDTRSPPRARGVESPPSYGYGLPLIFLFPFFPIIGIP